MVEKRGTHSERRACRVVGVSRSTVRYEPVPEPEANIELRKRMKKLAEKHKRYGYRRVQALLLREGWRVNRKRVHRLWKAEGLQVPRKRRRRRRGPKGEVVRRALYQDHVWSWDFIEDSTETGGKIRFLTIVDEYTRESLMIRAGRSLGAGEVVEALEGLFLTRGVPEYIRSDNGPELVAEKVRRWLEKSGVRTIYIERGSPWENPFIESFNGSFRDECLNMHVFGTVEEAGEIVEIWRRDYNEERPHSSLGYLTPAEFAAKCEREKRKEAVRAGSSSPAYGFLPLPARKGLDPIIATGTEIGGNPWNFTFYNKIDMGSCLLYA